MDKGELKLFGIPDIPLIKAGDDLGEILLQALENAEQTLQDGDIVVIAQKLVSKAEGRTVSLTQVTASDEARQLAAETDKEPEIVQLILDESNRIIRHRPGVLIAEHKLGFVLANAGIDRSNVSADDSEVLLLPEAPDASAQQLRDTLASRLGLRLAVIIIDSVGRAWRMGTIGMALGSCGIEALTDLRGRHDLFGRELQVSEHAIADAVAAAAELLMGEADEARPVIVVRGLDAGDSEQDSSALLRPAADDMFR